MGGGGGGGGDDMDVVGEGGSSTDLPGLADLAGLQVRRRLWGGHAGAACRPEPSTRQRSSNPTISAALLSIHVSIRGDGHAISWTTSDI